MSTGTSGREGLQALIFENSVQTEQSFTESLPCDNSLKSHYKLKQEHHPGEHAACSAGTLQCSEQDRAASAASQECLLLF